MMENTNDFNINEKQDINIANADRECREHREYLNQDNACAKSETEHPIDNSGNSSAANRVDHLDSPPAMSFDINIVRPCYKSHSDYFKLEGKAKPPGLYWHGTKDNNPVDRWIASPLEILAMASNTEGSNFGRLIKLLNSKNEWHTLSIPMRMLKGSGDEFIELLLDHGFTFERKHKSLLHSYFMVFVPDKCIKNTSTVGWHADSFVLPNKTIGDSEIIFQASPGYSDDFKTEGSLESWNETIGNYCRGNPALIFSISAALAGPLLSILHKQHGGGVHWVGDSSCGKSTSIEVAASVWGPPSFVRTWSTTANGLEGLAATRNDTCLILDEIDEASPYDVGKIAYMITNGQGKQRASKNGNARGINRWRTIALSTGERTLCSIMGEVNKKTNTGQLVRLLNLDANFKHGIFSDLHNFAGGREFADHLKSARSKHYGSLGPEFLKYLIDDEVERISKLAMEIGDIFKPLATHNIEQRASFLFELIAVAGELAIEYELVNWSKDSSLASSKEIFERWKSDNSSPRTEDEKILDSIRAFIDVHGDSRFDMKGDTSSERSVLYRAGWYEGSDKGVVYMFHNKGLMEAGGNYKIEKISKALDKAGWIKSKDKGRLTKKTSIRGSSCNLYHILIPDQT